MRSADSVAVSRSPSFQSRPGDPSAAPRLEPQLLLADPAVRAGFAARGVDIAAATRLVAQASGSHSDTILRDAVRTVAQTRLLDWDDCLRLASLLPHS